MGRPRGTEGEGGPRGDAESGRCSWVLTVHGMAAVLMLTVHGMAAVLMLTVHGMALCSVRSERQVLAARAHPAAFPARAHPGRRRRPASPRYL
eukprot:3938139-Rhodomonas_salina.2